METMNTKLIARNQAAEILGVTTRTLKRWEQAGSLRAHRDPATGRLYYEREQIEELAGAAVT